MIKLEYIKYIILGIIQGITEPLPVSSSGHIFLFKNMLNTELFNSLNFEIIANFGSFLAILFIFRKDIIILIKSFLYYMFRKSKRTIYQDNFLYILKIIISTIPVGVMGLIFSDYLESKYTSLKLLALAFIFTALMLFIVRNIKGEKKDKDISFKDAFIIGLFQMITIVPGISRSGTVLVACLLCKLSRVTALKYTFMLYFPVSIGTIILKLPELLNTPVSKVTPYLSGFLASLLVTYFSYQLLSNMVKNGKLWKFSIYCLCLALFIFIYFR